MKFKKPNIHAFKCINLYTKLYPSIVYELTKK